MSTEKATAAKKAKHQKELAVEVELQVKDIAHARSEEVVRYCIKELSDGSTWNELRRKLGLGHAAVDKRWRTLKDILCSSILPKTEEEALQASLTMSNYMISKMEQFIDYMEERVRDNKGKKSETDMLKIQLEAIKVQHGQYAEQFRHYAKFKDMADTDKRKHGASIIFQNNYYVPRPGDNLKFEDGKPVIDVKKPEKDFSGVEKLSEPTSDNRE